MRVLMRRAWAVVAVLVVVATIERSDAAFVADPVGDFLPTYSGPRNGDLDVVSAGVTFDGLRFVLSATMNGPLGTTPGALYVWGVDRGAGTPRFGALASGVLFDSVVSLQANGTGTVNRVIGGGSTALSLGDITIAGNTISATVLAALLPSQGLAPASYTFNLWPRLGAGNNNQIADFAPDNFNIGASTVPEPTSLAMTSIGFAAAVAFAHRREAKRGRSE